MALTIRTNSKFDKAISDIQIHHSIKTASGAIDYVVMNHSELENNIRLLENNLRENLKEFSNLQDLLLRKFKLEAEKKNIDFEINNYIKSIKDVHHKIEMCVG